MRPFYEQYFYNRRPRKSGGEKFLPHFINDFLAWHEESLAETDEVRDPEGWMTACSQLDPKEFRRIVRAGVGGYFRKNGEWPDFCTPASFGGMNILHSLLMPMPRKIPADKLMVGEYIPERYRDCCRPAEVVRTWGPDETPSFEGLAPGTYFLKSNHASAQVMKIVLPCDEATLAEARENVATWLATDYGKQSSQWWYRFIDRKAFLERDLNDAKAEGPLTDFRFHVINGKISVLQMDVGHGTEDRHNPVYDQDLNYLPYNFLRQNLREEPLPENADLARDIARTIGAGFQYCRVDLYLRGREVFLGELTFLPNAGRRHVRSPELDEMICADWDPMPKFVRISGNV
ncbi:ATP-grasp fold amidoligase family protein [Roseisalinus antarcticus]|uniref:TupA-like ATPgrasp n=1 Tax=Roseisalinus antarcticus TaxID=254357 RepID=A0A1Y5T3W5_9RHOB|nr:ATP-grasp fold amidoligase family protein [Roseisalinus antarcticus]SLN55373.1 hypothetical protein ROA7023_02518 [Roseisalinus antarcticus]